MNRSNKVGVLTPKNFQHDLSHQHVTTLDWFRIQPIGCFELVENDKFNINLSTILEAAPLATKVYGSAYLDIHAFFVPHRILWNDWLNYRYGNKRAEDNTYVPPFLTMSQLKVAAGMADLSPENEVFKFTPPTENGINRRRVLGSLGYPTSAILNYEGDGSIGVDTSYKKLALSLLPYRAYQRVWWDWYRDSVHIPESSKSSYLYTGGGAGNTLEINRMNEQYRCFRKDYITTLLESPQLGSASTAKVNLKEGDVSSYGGNLYSLYRTNPTTGYPFDTVSSSSASTNASSGTFVDYSHEISVSALRGAVAMQRYLEKLNVTGTRPIERIQSLFGSSPSPVRLDMSELIGTHRQRVNISGLTNTGSADNLAEAYDSRTGNAFGIDSYSISFGQQTGRAYNEGGTPNINYSASEDGFILVCASLVPEYANPTATNRMFFRGLSTPDSDKFDYYTPELDGIGYQECLMSEVCQPEFTEDTQGMWGIDYDPYKVVGYQPKYEDYRYIQDRVSGDFNEPSSSTALRNMVYVRNFQDGEQSGSFPTGVSLTTPNNNERAKFDNHFLVTDSKLDHFIFNVYFNIKASRPISKVELPTALSDMANSEFTDISNGGIRL